MAWTRADEERLTISCWVENEDAVGSDVCVSMVVYVDSAEQVDGVDSPFRRSFPRKGRTEIMSLDSKSGFEYNKCKITKINTNLVFETTQYNIRRETLLSIC